MSDDLLRLITPLRKALERIERKATPLLASPRLLETEEGEDSLDVICMQFISTGEARKRIEKIRPGLLAEAFPQIDWKGAMGFRDALPGVLAAIRSLERTIQVGETEGRKTEGPQSEQMGLGL